MTPELPIELPAGAILVEITQPDLECSMLRGGYRCGNIASNAIIYPTTTGYGLVALCQLCFDDRPAGWLEALEAMAGV